MATKFVLNPISGVFDLINDDSASSITSVNGDTGPTVQLDAIDIPYDNATSGLMSADVQSAIDELAEQKTYIETFNSTTDWGSPSGGYYTITVLATTHEAGTNPIIQVYENIAGNLEFVSVDRIMVNTSGDVSIRVLSSPDLRFAGKLYIASKVAGVTGGSGDASWGSITGTLSDQSDLQNALDGKQNLIDGNYGNLSILGTDVSGNVTNIPNISIDNISGGILEQVTVQPNDNGYVNLNSTNLNLDPLQNSPNETWVTNNTYITIDPNNTGFSLGTNGNSVQVDNKNINHQGSSDIGGIQFTSNNFNLGNGVDPIAVKGFGYNFGFGTVNSNVNITGPMQGYGFQPNIDEDATIDSSIYSQAFYDGLNADCPIPSYTSFNASPNLTEVMNNSSYQGTVINPTISSFAGNARFTGVGIYGQLNTFDTGQYHGVDINPQINSINYAVGIDVNMDNVSVYPGSIASLVIQDLTISANLPSSFGNTVEISYVGGGTAGSEVVSQPGSLQFEVQIEDGVSTANQIALALNNFFGFTSVLNVMVSGVGSNPQNIQSPTNLTGGTDPGSKRAANFNGDVNINGNLQFSGGLSIGSLNAFATQPLFDNGGSPSSLQLLITSPTVAANDTINNADFLGVNTAMLLQMGDNSTVTTGFLGVAALGLPAVVSMGSGATIDRVCGAAFALSLDASATGGSIDVIDLCRSIAIPNGATSVNKLKGYQFDLPFGNPATTTWGIYMQPDCHNYIQGSLLIGGTAGSDDTETNSSVAFEIKSTTKAFVNARMTSSQRDALTAINGMQIYNSTTDKLQVYSNGSWVDLH